jgi:hypothetical protein
VGFADEFAGDTARLALGHTRQYCLLSQKGSLAVTGGVQLSVDQEMVSTGRTDHILAD